MDTWNLQLDVGCLGGKAGLDISQGAEANGCGALTDWPCALKNSFHIFHLPRPCPAEMALKMGALQFSYVKPWESHDSSVEKFRERSWACGKIPKCYHCIKNKKIG
jgi:hypothetical protein